MSALPPLRPAFCVASLVALAAGFALERPVLSQQSGPPVFRSGVDLVLIEVQAVDADGAPVEGLTPANFDVEIDGRRRTVVSADFLRESNVNRTAAPNGGVAARNFWPEDVAGPGRTIVLAFDTATLAPGDSVHVRNAARGFVSQLSPADAIGVVTLPRGTAVAPTRDHAAALAVLSTVTGYHSTASSSYNMTEAEIIDMDADLEQTIVVGGGRGSLVPGSVLQQVQARECRGGNDSSCVAGIILEAEAQARLMHERAADTINGLNRLLRLLSEFPERKTVVLFSGGMAVGDRWIHDSGAVESLGRAAALANSTVYAIHVDTGYQSVYNAEVRRARPTTGLGREREVQRGLLSGFATTSGGEVFSAATGAGESALRRVLLETSAVYALGIEPAPRDLDGKPHELRVRVQPRGITLRNLRYVLLRSAQR